VRRSRLRFRSLKPALLTGLIGREWKGRDEFIAELKDAHSKAEVDQTACPAYQDGLVDDRRARRARPSSSPTRRATPNPTDPARRRVAVDRLGEVMCHRVDWMPRHLAM